MIRDFGGDSHTNRDAKYNKDEVEGEACDVSAISLKFSIVDCS